MDHDTNNGANGDATERFFVTVLSGIGTGYGERQEVSKGSTVGELIARLGIDARTHRIRVNREPAEQGRILSPDDRITVAAAKPDKG